MKRPLVFALLISIPVVVNSIAHASTKRNPSRARKPAQEQTTAQSSEPQLPTKLPAKKPSRAETAAPAQEPTAAAAATGTETQQAPASAKPSRVPLDASSAVRLNYGFPGWNKDPKKIDTASILMREGSTGRIVQIYLEETAPDSSIFSGLYSINWRNIEQIQVEFYLPPQELLGSAEGMKKLRAMLDNRELRRHPFILRRTSTGQQTVEIFDTREQALAALKTFRSEQQLLSTQNKKFPSDQEVDTARLAEELRQREAAAKFMAERVRLEQVEARRLQELLNKFISLSPVQKAERKRQAQALAVEALALYGQDRFQESAAKFDQAVELDPETRSYYYQFGIALYRLSNYNRSIVYVQLADDPAIKKAERDYYIALNLFGQREFANATAAFDKVIAANDPELSVSAKFYKGLIKYEQKLWDEAQPIFQQVLDTSKDPRLDERAEQYLELILRMKQAAAERARKWQISGTFGEMYDTNILLSSDSARDQGTASDSSGYRSLLMGSVRYRPLYEDTHEFAVQLDVLTMYTLSSSFQSSQELTNTDPTMATLTLPWTYKGLLFGKGYKLDITPGYETIYMSIENNENKEIISSMILNFANMFVMNNNWFANYNLEMRSDSSKLTSSTGENDSSAVKVKLANSNMIFLTEDKSKILMTDFGYTLNQAQGKNATYNRIDLGVGYMQPMMWGLVGNAKLGLFQLNYPQKSDSRSDMSYTLTGGASRKINDIWSAGFTANYNINQSNVDASAYSKWTAMLTLSGMLGF